MIQCRGTVPSGLSANLSGNEKPTTVRPYLWMLSAALAFAAMGAFAHSLKETCGWPVIALARAAVPLVLAGTMAWLAGATLVLRGPASLWLRSIAGSLSLVCTFYALTRLPVSEVLTLTHLSPVWIAVLSWPLLRQAPTRGVWLCVATGLAGVLLVLRPRFADGNFAAAASVAASLFGALAMIGLHRLQRIDTRAIVFHFSMVSLAFCTASLFLFGGPAAPAGLVRGSTLGLLAGVGLTATAGQFLLTKAFTCGVPARVSVVGLTQVAFGMGFDVLFWGRSFSPATLAGMALVLAPTAWLLAAKPEELALGEAGSQEAGGTDVPTGNATLPHLADAGCDPPV